MSRQVGEPEGEPVVCMEGLKYSVWGSPKLPLWLGVYISITTLCTYEQLAIMHVGYLMHAQFNKGHESGAGFPQYE